MYYARAISQIEGKLLLSNKVAKFANKFKNIKIKYILKNELFNNYCTLIKEKNMF